MTRRTQHRPTAVSARTKQVGEVRARWAWTEASVWTEPMLTALEEGVKGGKWYSLIDKVVSCENLASAFAKVQANKGAPGVDHVTPTVFAEDLARNLRQLVIALEDGTYRPQSVKRVLISKLGTKEKRPLGIPTVRDRTLQGALRHVIEPIFEQDFSNRSYGFRPGRGCKSALRCVEYYLQQGYNHVVDVDLKSYFDTIPHDKLLDRIRRKISDGPVLDLIEKFLKQGILHDLKYWKPEEGTPQGAVISPLLANIYLDPLDHMMSDAGLQMVRYADDFVILCQSREEAERALQLVANWVEKAGLTLHPTKTRIVDAHAEGFDFLGYHFERGMKWPRDKSLKKLKDTLRARTRRTQGNSLPQITQSVNVVLRGWFEYFKHSHSTTFRWLDSWVRMRLRSILRKRMKKKGRGRGSDHQRWPNAFFAAHGLYSLVHAHQQARQSARR